ncbi:MAG: tetratricopeptide repeat protein [Thermoanaerobaculia bacterium]|nr:hypothetical protein [Thermoanaerobaculia bacterium]MCK6682983.1 tetratricopeptide repeat protein [Thermoanaerobaculia bacterium]
MSPILTDGGVSRNVAFFDHGLFLLHLNRGKEELRKGRYEEAKKELEDARRFRPNDPEVLANLGFTLFHLGHFEEAEEVTRHVLLTHPTSVPLLFNLGLILFKSGRTKESVEPLERVLALQPGHRKAHLTLGLALQRLGSADKAKEHLKSAGADRKAGTDLDDTVSRAARAAAKSEEPKPEPEEEVRPRGFDTSPIVKPERFDQISTAEVPRLAPAETKPAPPPPPPSPPPPPAETAPKSSLDDTQPAAIAAAETLLIARSGPIPVITRPPDTVRAAGSFTPGTGGFLSADCRKGLIVRRNVITGRRGSLYIQPERTQSGSLAGLFVEARGPGILLLVEKQRQPVLLTLSDSFLSVDPLHVLAFEDSLAFREDPAFEFRRLIPLPFLKLFGTGVLALSASTEPARLEVTPENPLSLTATSVVAYSEGIEVDILEGADPLERAGLGPVIRFSGTGHVLADSG